MPDAGGEDGPDGGPADVPEDGGGEDVPGDGGPEDAPDGGQDGGEDATDGGPADVPDGGTDTTDTGTDTTDAGVDTTDTGTETTLPPECSAQLENFQVTAGECSLEVCPISFGDFDGFEVEMSGAAGEVCVAEVSLPQFSKKATLTVENDSNGAIKLTCELFPNDSNIISCEGGANVSAFVEEEGGQTPSIEMHTYGVVTGSAASKFLVIPRGTNADGSLHFEVASFNEDGEPPVTVSNELFNFSVPNDGQMYVIDVESGTIEPIGEFPDKPDAGPDEDTNPGTDTNVGTDTQNDNPPSGGCSSCSTTGESPGTTGVTLALLMAGLALARSRKRFQIAAVEANINEARSHVPGAFLGTPAGIAAMKKVFSPTELVRALGGKIRNVVGRLF